MQTVTYQIRLPNIGEHLDINGTQFVVDNYENSSPPYDRIIIQNLNDNTLTRLVITNGNWQPDSGDIFTINFATSIITPPITTPQINAQRGIFHETENVSGSRKRTGVIIDYPFTITTIISQSEIVVNFGSSFPDHKYPTASVKEGGIHRPIGNNGIRTLTLRQNGNWVFKGLSKLYAGDSIELL